MIEYCTTNRSLIALFGLISLQAILLVPDNDKLLQLRPLTAMAQPLLPHRGPPMARTWSVLSGITPHFLTSVTNGRDYWPCFSPDGLTVLFSRTSDGHSWKFFRVPVSGGVAEELVRPPLSVAATRASWSPTSNLIAFTGISTANAAAIWLINGDGKGLMP